MSGERGSTGAFAVAVLMVAIAVASGCSSGKGPADWFGSDSKTAKPKEQVYYAGADALPLYDGPRSGAKVVGQLALHQKVIRTRVENGYALVRPAQGGREGWVLNARLIWKLPAAAGVEPPATSGDSPQPAQAEAVVSEEAPAAELETPAVQTGAPAAEPEAPATKPAADKARPRSGASVFDPY